MIIREKSPTLEEEEEDAVAVVASLALFVSLLLLLLPLEIDEEDAAIIMCLSADDMRSICALETSTGRWFAVSLARAQRVRKRISAP